MYIYETRTSLEIFLSISGLTDYDEIYIEETRMSLEIFLSVGGLTDYNGTHSHEKIENFYHFH